MATVTPTVATKNGTNRVVVTWAGVVTGDTITAHVAQRPPALVSFQHNGTYANGTSVGLSCSNDGTNFVDAEDNQGDAITAALAAAFHSVAFSAVEYKPTIASGSADSVTFTLAYWG